MKLLKKDFDNAVKQDWSARKCLIAQCMIRNNIEIKKNWSPLYFAAYCDKANRAGQIFDRHFERRGDEKKPEMQELRALLPIEISCSVNVA